MNTITRSPIVLRRPHFVALALVTIGAGLVVHYRGELLGDAARDMIGDALWAMMMAWWVGAIARHSRPVTRGAIALAVSFAVELSQLIHPPAFDRARASTIGHLVLGSGFDPRDLVSYTLGVVAAVLIERALHRRGS